jgi:hypothetical protein
MVALFDFARHVCPRVVVQNNGQFAGGLLVEPVWGIIDDLLTESTKFYYYERDKDPHRHRTIRLAKDGGLSDLSGRQKNILLRA